jgi:DNA-binding IclR family transcriptional regulator
LARIATGKEEDAEASPRYAAPALEKGLDIIELLARSENGMNQTQIAQALHRSVAEVYRVMMSLERRGYIARRAPGDAFMLTARLAGLAAEQPPTARLLGVADPVMRRIANDASQAIHLAVLDGTEIFILTKVDSPAPIGLHVRLGSRHPIGTTASGRILVAFAAPSIAQWTIERAFSAPNGALARSRFERRIAAVRQRGYEFIADETLQGVTSLSFPLIDAGHGAVAALTIPFLAARQPRVPVQEAAWLLGEGAREISTALGGGFTMPTFPLTDPMSSHQD